ncbi:MAG TPA: acyl carrier protein [Pyrinomonadaceae bacterium]
MTEAEIFQKTVQHMGEYLERDIVHLSMDSRLDAIAPDMDSLKLFEMILYLEDCFNVDFDQSSLGNIETMRDLVTYIESMLSVKDATV